MRKNCHSFFAWTILFMFLCKNGYSQNAPASFTLFVLFAVPKTASPQSINLDAFTHATDSVIPLLEIIDGKKRTIAAQVEKKEKRFLHRMVITSDQKKSIDEYIIVEKKESLPFYENPAGQFLKNKESLVLQSHVKPLVNYYYAMNYPPAGINTAYITIHKK